ncbi:MULTISPECIES: glycoside hydrolase family 3 C-terminal domain-containing protein [Burkholderia]|uniref:glycoside hydrolase family 3 C-terminal domain-containing protein n=1 Tax=Burkholderia TaxID=32008 RepID=UPI00064EEA4A|nr:MULTISPECIES: glycoside hydrolase family 3 C-terminal domain-containing protein [Burkholderia]KML14061.1 beta-glucosidase [Burkholderia cepacia]KML38157.1 beta-glucosidase [Burkholderia lata]KMN55228.1 beta-glucosidase [Burkholderia sp. LK4]
MKTSLFRCSTIASACALTVLLASCGGDDIHAGPAAPADPDAAADQRAAALVAQLTNDEKLQLVHGTGLPALDLGGPFPADALNGASYIPGVPRLGIPAVSSADSAGGVNVKNARVTALPAPVALAATWDPALAGTYGTRIALELRALGFAEGLGGGVNLAREPRNGRTFEYMGEDPVLAGTLSAARTQATQAQKVIATIKHFAFNDQETNRMTIDSVVDERTMREAELLAFEIGVKDGQPGNVMCSYNKLNGVYACENPYLLTTVLKNEWGFKGVVQSDWGATHSTVAAVQAGLDEEEPGAADDNNAPLGSFFNTKLRAALQAGSVSAARLNDMVQRKLRTLIRIGVMDAPPKPGGAIDEAAGNADALAIARQSAVLLKNAAAPGDAQPVLPLAAGALKSVVVIGGHADAGVLSGGGSGAVPAIDGNAVTTCQQPADTLFGGCATWYKSAPLAAIRSKAPNAAVSYLDGTDANAAASAAAQADVAIVFATQWQTEGLDLASLSLPDAKADPYNQQYDQNALIAAVAAKAKRVIVVLENGSPVLMPWLANVHGVLEAWYPGAQGGQAIADLLFGDANPSGRLPLTFPKQEADLPQPAIDPSRTQTVYAEGLAYGYRWFDAKAIEPLFPFGYGLSYTTYALSALSARADAAGNVTVGVTVTNTGARAGAQTVQIYAALPASLGEPPKRLVGWTKVALQPGEARTVSVAVPAQRFAVWDANAHAWRIAEGSYGLSAAASSRDPQAQSTTVTLAAH